MNKINAAITAVGGYLPSRLLTNADLEKMVDTNDEWITTRVGIKTRHILDEDKGSSYMAIQAVNDMFERNHIDPLSIEGIILASVTPDYHFPSTSSIVAHETGCLNAFTFDLQSACPGFMYALETGANYIRSGRYKRLVVVATEKMSAAVDYSDRATAPLFGDGSGCVLLEATEQETGVMDAYFRTNGDFKNQLIMKSGGSLHPATSETVERREHFVYQEGQAVFKNAVLGMSSACSEVMRRNALSKDDVTWFIPHQANMRIIDAVARHLEVPKEHVMINIQETGNTSSATIPICLWEWEKQLHRGDVLILTSFGAGFTWGAMYVKWAYDGDKRSNVPVDPEETEAEASAEETTGK